MPIERVSEHHCAPSRAPPPPLENRIVGDSMATMLSLMHVRRSSKMAKFFPASGKRLLEAHTKGESSKASSGSIWIIRGARERRFEGELSWPARLRQSARLPPPTCPLKCIFVSLLLATSSPPHLRALHSRHDSKERYGPLGAPCPHWTFATPWRETVTARRWAAATRAFHKEGAFYAKPLYIMYV